MKQLLIVLGQFFGAVAKIALACVLVPAMVVLAVILIGLLLSALAVAWAVGARLTIKQNNVVIGHLRWFTFTPVSRLR
jgi:hypothetical protein